MTKTHAAPGSVYLAASHHDGTLQAMAERALAHVARKPAKVAVSYAAAHGENALVKKMMSSFERLFSGADVKRFTVEGEHGAQTASEARAIVEDADLIFLGGGDPVLGARLLVEAGADEWLREARARGAACLGVSAGSMMLCAWWASWPDEPVEGVPFEGGELVSCTRVVPDLVVDCHAEDDGWNELHLVRAMLRERLEGDEDLPRMIGIPTAGGIVVSPDGAIEPFRGAPFRLV